jgi:hypothetical protein
MRPKLAKNVKRTVIHLTLDAKTDSTLKKKLKKENFKVAEYIRNLIIFDLFNVIF